MSIRGPQDDHSRSLEFGYHSRFLDLEVLGPGVPFEVLGPFEVDMEFGIFCQIPDQTLRSGISGKTQTNLDFGKFQIRFLRVRSGIW